MKPPTDTVTLEAMSASAGAPFSFTAMPVSYTHLVKCKYITHIYSSQYIGVHIQALKKESKFCHLLFKVHRFMYIFMLYTFIRQQRKCLALKNIPPDGANHAVLRVRRCCKISVFPHRLVGIFHHKAVRRARQKARIVVIITERPVSYTHLDVYKRQFHWFDEPDGSLEHIPALAGRIAELIRTGQPDVVFCPDPWAM